MREKFEEEAEAEKGKREIFTLEEKFFFPRHENII
jgi:hypothetical protein